MLSRPEECTEVSIFLTGTGQHDIYGVSDDKCSLEGNARKILLLITSLNSDDC